MVASSTPPCPVICICIKLRRTLVQSLVRVLLGRGSRVDSFRLLSGVLGEGALGLTYVHPGEATFLTALG